MTEIFVDTSGFFALLAARDPAHDPAVQVLATARKSRRPFVTTDYVIDETATLLRARGLGRLTTPFLDLVLSSAACRVEWMDPDRFQETRSFFERHSDKAWSFTDCSSFIVMRELELRDALTKDAHFRAAGFRPLLV